MTIALAYLAVLAMTAGITLLLMIGLTALLLAVLPEDI